MAGRKLVVEVAADISQLVKGLRLGEQATSTFTKQITVDSRAMANAQVQAAVRTTEALEKEAAALRMVANTAEKGSREQIAAARLAEQAERKLAGQMGVAAGEARRLGSSAARADREIGAAARGALTGSGIFRGFGRSLVFASGGFLAFQGVTEFLRGSVDAAREAAVAQRSLAAQMKASGESFAANRDEIEKAALSYGKFGFENDEVVAGLTVLERGTGNVRQALSLLTLTGDIARAKGVGLAASAQVVAKVFGGQETALRRAVPGLSKHAHGMDLIREASAKMSGQMAANTTAAERFHATLHDTEEIVGTALLPTLNRYLDSLGKWLQKENESGDLQRKVAAAAGFLKDAVGALKGVMDGLNTITGSTKRSLEVLFGVLVAYKTLKVASSLAEIAGNIGLVGTKAAESTGKVAVLRGNLVRLVANPYTITFALVAIGAEVIAHKIAGLQKQMLDAQSATFAQGSGLETTLVPRLAKQIDALKAAGKTSAQIIATLRKQLGGSLKADDLIAEAFSFGSGSDPKLRARIQKQVAAARSAVTRAADGPGSRGPRPLSLQGRFNLQELKLAQAQLTKTEADDRRILVVEKAIVEQQIGQAKSLKDRIQLTQQLGGIVGQIRGIDQQAADAVKQQTQARKDAAKAAAEAAKQAREAAKAAKAARLQTGIDWLDFGLEKAQATKKVSDDIAAEKKIIAALKEQARLTGLTVDIARQIFEHRQNLADLTKQKAGPQKTLLEAGFQYSGFAPGVLPPMLRPSSKPLPLPPALRLPGQGGVVINGGVHLHGVHDVPKLEQELQKRTKSRQQPRRGRR